MATYHVSRCTLIFSRLKWLPVKSSGVLYYLAVKNTYLSSQPFIVSINRIISFISKIKNKKYHTTRKIKKNRYEGITILLQSMNEQLSWLSLTLFRDIFYVNRLNFLTMIR